MSERLVLLVLLGIVAGLLHGIAFWRRKPVKRRMQPHGAQAGKTKGTAIAVWQ